MPWLPDAETFGGWFSVALMVVCAAILLVEVLR